MHWPLPNPPVETPYNPIDVIKGLTEYYELLSRSAYFPPDTIEKPPSEGWTNTQLDTDLLKKFGRSDAVVGLLRHIPYIKAGPAGEWQIWPETYSVRYLRGPHTSNWVGDYEQTGIAPPMPMEDLPSHIVSLATGYSGSTAWIIDTNEGLMYGLGSSLKVDTQPEEKPWMVNRGYPVQYFFEMAKADLLNLTNIPVPMGVNDGTPEIICWEGKVPRRLRRLYQQHGWPDLPAFNRDTCTAALIALCRAEADNDLSDSTTADDQMELDDDDDDDDDVDYSYQERDPSGSEHESDDDDIDVYDAQGSHNELKEELKDLRKSLKKREWKHINPAAEQPDVAMGSA